MIAVGKVVHKNVLIPSTEDTVALCFAVQERFIILLDSYAAIKGEALIPPREFDSAMIRWREMAVRFKKSDFRNSEEELTSLREIAQWTLDENCKLRNQPLKKMFWG